MNFKLYFKFPLKSVNRKYFSYPIKFKISYFPKIKIIVLLCI